MQQGALRPVCSWAQIWPQTEKQTCTSILKEIEKNHLPSDTKPVKWQVSNNNQPQVSQAPSTVKSILLDAYKSQTQ